MKNYILAGLLGLLLIALGSLTACTNSPNNNFAPVTNGWTSQSASRFYRVQPDDTLYSIAFRFGMDAQKLAALNHLSGDNNLVPGQKLRLSDHSEADNASLASGVVTNGAPASIVASQPVDHNNLQTVTPDTGASQPAALTSCQTSSKTIMPDNDLTAANSRISPAAIIQPPLVKQPFGGKFIWPLKGKVIQGFSQNYGGNKGLDIAAGMGDLVKASETGKIVYCGSGLKGYGILIIIKHNSQYLSAYAHNSKTLVKEGQTVYKGEIIALAGNSDAVSPLLHFEIRQSGKPVDPLKIITGGIKN